ncbi:MAG TPA: hypothetical protein VHM67_14000 [Gemmatimonadaceae bacterium]|nr:hypothetical protein [Gemmatimonadaceae bacterium]
MSRPLRAGARLWDAGALALVVAGAALYIAAGSGLKGVETNPTRRASVEHLNLKRADRWRFTSYAGLLLIAAGVGLGAYSWHRARLPVDATTPTT